MFIWKHLTIILQILCLFTTFATQPLVVAQWECSHQQPHATVGGVGVDEKRTTQGKNRCNECLAQNKSDIKSGTKWLKVVQSGTKSLPTSSTTTVNHGVVGCCSAPLTLAICFVLPVFVIGVFSVVLCSPFFLASPCVSFSCFSFLRVVLSGFLHLCLALIEQPCDVHDETLQ